MAVEWSRKSYSEPAESNLLRSWFYSKNEDAGKFQDFIFLFLMLIKGMKRRDEFNIFLRDSRDGKILPRSSGSC